MESGREQIEGTNGIGTCITDQRATTVLRGQRVELAASHGIKLEVSKRERLERQTVIDPIPALFVCVLPDGPLQFGCGTWLTSRKSTRSDAVVPTAKKGNAHRLSGLLGK